MPRQTALGGASLYPHGMHITVTSVLALAALIVAILAAMSRAPLWLAVILLAIIELLRVIPQD
jgi:hypothetical protein